MKEVMQQLADQALRDGLTMNEVLDAFHKQLLESALKLDSGNIFRSAQRQHLHRNTMSRQLQRFGVQRITVAGKPWGGKKLAV